MLHSERSTETSRKLVESETQLRALLDQGIAGVYVVAESGRVLYVNDGFARLIGYTAADVVGTPFWGYVPTADHPRLVDVFQRTLAGHANQIETNVLVRGGGTRTVLTEAAPAQQDGTPVVIGVVIDISDRKVSELALFRANRLLKIISAGNETLVRTHTETELIQKMCDVIVSIGNYRAASVTVADTSGRSQTAHAGELPDQTRTLKTTLGNPDDRHASEAMATRTGAEIDQNRAAVYLPLKSDGKLIGGLGVQTRETHGFTAEEIALFGELAEGLAYGVLARRDRLEREAMSGRLYRSMEDTVAALAATVEMRDPYTAGHQQHVAELGVAIAREMGLDESRVHAIRLASLVHDVGKIKIPAELLNKPDRLTDLEAHLLQTHSQAGYDILKGIDFPWSIADIVWQHHERLDGSGYPRGLLAADIHLEAKIIAVADVVDAMSANRPYRRGQGTEAALASLEAGRSVLYENDVVDACVRVIRRDEFRFSQDPLLVAELADRLPLVR